MDHLGRHQKKAAVGEAGCCSAEEGALESPQTDPMAVTAAAAVAAAVVAEVLHQMLRSCHLGLHLCMDNSDAHACVMLTNTHHVHHAQIHDRLKQLAF